MYNVSHGHVFNWVLLVPLVRTKECWYVPKTVVRTSINFIRAKQIFLFVQSSCTCNCTCKGFTFYRGADTCTAHFCYGGFSRISGRSVSEFSCIILENTHFRLMEFILQMHIHQELWFICVNFVHCFRWQQVMYSALFSQFKMKPLNHTIFLWMIGGIVDFRSFIKVEFPPLSHEIKRGSWCVAQNSSYTLSTWVLLHFTPFNSYIFGEYANSSEIVISIVKVQIYCQNMQRVTGCNMFFFAEYALGMLSFFTSNTHWDKKSSTSFAAFTQNMLCCQR